MTTDLSPQPFDSFYESVASAGYEDARRMPGAAVESAYAFEEMRAYLLDLYKGVRVVESLVETDGQVIDCVRPDTHPAAWRWGGLATAPAEGPPRVPEPYEPAPPAPGSRDDVRPAPRSLVTAGACPEGSTPLYRTTLPTMCRFPTLAAFMAKGGRTRLAEPAADVPLDLPRRYATGEQDIDCLGGSSVINVWNPFASAGFQGTFSQQWYTAGQEGTLMQTVECGWHVDLDLYHNADPHLFVFATRKNYEPGHRVYNLDDGVFRPVDSPYLIPGAPLPYSQTGGSQIGYQMGFYLTGNAWWFYFEGHPIGCFPVEWFNGGPLTTKATRATFGGETANGLAMWPPMGSGRYATAGFGQAAYQRSSLVYPMGGGAVDSSLAEAGSVTGQCYSLQITNNSVDPDWGTYLFFGGPGGNSC
ncbi:neprosin family prolyl endopeptidase [Streptomyces sioyaensis]|uniref:neprosin family prolyl endopeptidase n=1 Tax=Streptomyces sioyaensis TaxID=67364 RepID=UPI0036E27A89